MKSFHFAIAIVAIALSATGNTAMAAENAQTAAERNALLGYPDTSFEHWAFEGIWTASISGVMEGYPDGLFRGDQPLTRYEFSVVLRRMSSGSSACYGPGPAPRFRWKSLDELEQDRLFPPARSTDVPRDHHASEAVQLVQRLGIMQGNMKNEFQGDKPLTRYELVTAQLRLQQILAATRVPIPQPIPQR